MMAIAGVDSQNGRPIMFDRHGRRRVNGDTVIDENSAPIVGERIKNNICLCKPCVIYLLSCHVGLGSVGQGLADGTGCTVYAPNGFCYPNINNPDKSRITAKAPEYPDYNPNGSCSGMTVFFPKGTF